MFAKIDKIFSVLEKIVSCICVIVMSVLVFINVIARFVFNNSLAFSDEISTYLFVLMSFMGTAIAARRGAHRVSPKARICISMFTYGISALFCLLIVIFGVQMVVSQYQLGQESAAMQWPEWIYGSFVPIGAAFATLAFIQGIYEQAKQLITGKEDK